MSGINALIKHPRELPCPFCLKDSVGRWVSIKQEVGSHQTPKLPVPQSWTCQSPELWRYTFLLFISHPVYGTLSSPNGLRQCYIQSSDNGEMTQQEKLGFGFREQRHTQLKASVGYLRHLSLLEDLELGHLSLKKKNKQEKDEVGGGWVSQAADRSRQVGGEG